MEKRRANFVVDRCRSLGAWLGLGRDARRETPTLSDSTVRLEAAPSDQAAQHARALEDASDLTRSRYVRMLAVVAHELRNPLGPMRNAVAAITCGRPEEVLRARLIIDRQITQMSRLIDDLMDLSRANLGKFSLVMERVRLDEIVDHAVRACRPALEGRNQRLVVAGNASGCDVSADPLRLLQILGNLLDNASKYSPDFNVIHLDVLAMDSQVVLSVTDYGIGIASEALGRIFEPFVQEVRASEFDRSGLGVGLAVVHDLVEAHGGRVTASSDGIGRGARFAVALPRFVQPAP
jgi:signal transduction histidine kinase